MLVDYLRGRRLGASLEELSQRFGVSERQIRRDAAAIQEAGHSCEPTTVRGKAGYRLGEGRPGSVYLSLRERYSLLAVRRLFDVLQGTPFAEDVRNIFDKVVASLPEAQQQSIETLGDRFVYLADGGVKIYEGKSDVLDALLTGVIRRGRVRCSYRSAAKRTSSGELEPYAMVLYRHGLYVIGCFPKDEEPRTFAVERFRKAEYLRGTRFEPPPDFVVDDYFDGAFGVFTGGPAEKVVVEFEPAVVHLVRARTWHPTQELTRRRDGGIRMQMTAQVTPQLMQWLVGWGPHVNVREPTELRAAVRAEHRAAAQKHASQRP